MTGTSHAITGAAIGLIVKEPALALPLAFLSHFICDMLPHFGLHTIEERNKHIKMFHRTLIVDSILLGILFLVLLLVQASPLVFACAILAGSPDFAWAYRYIFLEKFGKLTPPHMNLFNRFHSRIQTLESLKGVYFEVPYTLLLILIIAANYPA